VSLQSGIGRAVELVVDLEAVMHNARAVRAVLSQRTRLYACLKGNAYGIGIGSVAPVLAAAGIDAFAVGSIEDALEVRRAGCEHEILLYPNCMPDAAPVVERERLTITISGAEEAHAWNCAARRTIDAFVKIDAGVLRAGVLPRQAPCLARTIRGLKRLRIAGAYTHLHLPDPAGMREYAERQFSNFRHAVAAMRESGLEIPAQMVSGSAALLEFPHTDLDAVDQGRFLFGLGFEGVKRRLELRPTLIAWRARLLLSKEVDRTDIGKCGAAPFPMRRTHRVGLIAVGWGDSIPRPLPDAAIALVRGRRVRLLPPIHFEHVRADLTDVPEAKYDDEVALPGAHDEEHIELEELARWMGRDPLHVLGTMPRHLTRVDRSHASTLSMDKGGRLA
jgi:alanine racemase